MLLGKIDDLSAAHHNDAEVVGESGFKGISPFGTFPGPSTTTRQSQPVDGLISCRTPPL